MYTIQLRGAQAPQGEFFDSEIGGGGPTGGGLPGGSPK